MGSDKNIDKYLDVLSLLSDLVKSKDDEIEALNNQILFLQQKLEAAEETLNETF